METTLVQARHLSEHLADPDWIIVDCRFSLGDTQLGRRQYHGGHIPGAIYAHLDEDLSGEILPGKTSRHPLPKVARFAKTLSVWGIGEGVQVVAYDDSGGAIAARLWWMLRWLGHGATAVLNGGWSEWKRLGLPMSAEVGARIKRDFKPRLQADWLVDSKGIMSMRNSQNLILVDVRDPERYRGEVEPLDAKAGHIPGAINLPYQGNLDGVGMFLEREALREKYEKLLEGRAAEQAVFYCGSGVTAAHSLLAMAHAGLGEGKLYADSWSGWITDESKEIETGEGKRGWQLGI